MIDSFKKFRKTIGHALCYIVRHTLVVGWVVQEEFNKKVRRKPRFLEFISDIFKTQEMCIKALEVDPWLFKYVPDNLKTQGVCEKSVNTEPWLLLYVPDTLKT